MNLTEINCKELFQKAYEKRYTWANDFRGYEGKCIFSLNSDTYEGNFVLGKDFKTEIQSIDDQKIVKSISSQLFEVCIHRVKREFQEIHSKNNFNLIKDSVNGTEMIVSGKSEGDKYRVKNNRINMVYRKIHGIIIEIFVQEFFDTGNGFLSKRYTSQQIDPITLKANSMKLEYEDSFINIGSKDIGSKDIGSKDIWILNSRFVKYLNKNQEEEVQKFIFEDLSLLV